MSGERWRSDGLPCLACHTRTFNEGQLCTDCADNGHRRENDTLILNLTPFIRASPGTTFSMFTAIPEDSENAPQPD